MIEKLTNNIEKLEKIFPEVIKKGRVENDLANNPFSNYYIYKDCNKIIAFINFDIMYERMELIDIYVIDNYRNKKVATKLMNQMLIDAQINDVKSISLEVRKDNNKAIKMYEKYGFKQVAIRKGYYQGIDGLLMEKR
ncbi:MAG: GNAT family N-acetyltransferase [Bacilli bacterium]|nr:GNAT family N-acetyltransferase [Bacilli bacterium]